MSNLADVSAADCDAMLELVCRAADPTVELQMPERKRRLADGLAALIDADVWMWSATAVNHDVPGDVMTTHMIDDGWQSEEERIRVYAALTSSAFSGETMLPLYHAMRLGRHSTSLHDDLFTPSRVGAGGQSLGCHGAAQLYPVLSSGVAQCVEQRRLSPAADKARLWRA